jgi:hypothetical protein
MAAILPLPSAANDFSWAIEVKLLLKDAAEMVGVAPEALAELEALVDELLLELEDELPHAATTAAIASAGNRTRSQRGMKDAPLLEDPKRMPSGFRLNVRRLSAGVEQRFHKARFLSTNLNQK